jgi:hypothetical protein
VIDEAQAVTLVAASRALREPRRLGEAQELRQGWYFPTRFGDRTIGCRGVIVNKQTGRLFHVSNAFPVARGLDLYERGYQFEVYDLTVVGVRNRKATLKTLTGLGVSIVEPELQDGVVWKIPRRLSNDELAGRLERLPSVFSGLRFCSQTELLEAAREANCFTFELTEHAS